MNPRTDSGEVVLGKRASPMLTLVCPRRPGPRFLQHRPILFFVDRSHVASVSAGGSARIELPARGAELRALAPASLPWFVLFLYPAVIPHSLYGLAQRTGRLNRLSNALAIELAPVKDPTLGFVAEVDRSTWRFRGVKQRVSGSHNSQTASTPPTEFVVVPGEQTERVVYDLPISLVEGSTYSRTVRVMVTEGVEITTRSESATLEVDAKLISAMVEKHIGEDVSKTVTRAREETDSIELVAMPGGSNYRYQWVEKWRSASIQTRDTGQEVATISYREELGPRTIED